jgi:PQQ-like domain
MPELPSPHLVASRPALSAAGDRLRNLFRFCLLVLAWFFCGPMLSLLAQTPTPVTVPTWRYDLTHAGQNINETALTPANVNVNSFGKLFSQPADGSVYAQPLYVPGLTMSDGLVHNVLFVATEHDTIYAFDADSNGGANANPIWQISLLDAAHGASSGATTVPWGDEGSEDIEPEIGITGTPVINPSTNTMYAVGATKENGAYFLRLHAINILTGAEQANSPVAIEATVAGTGTGSSGGKLAFSPLWQNQRGALNYYNGYVYFGFSSHGDNGPWHGWIYAYNATTLAQTAFVCTSPNGLGDGVWGAGAGLPIDNGGTAGRMFFVTGNGSYSAYPPFNGSVDFGDSIVDLNLSNGGLTPSDAFTPFNQATLASSDEDQGSGGILMVPDQQGANPHILIQVGKEGRILVLNRDHLGGYATGVTSNTNALQDITGETGGLWSTPAYWNGNVYMWGSGDVPKLFQLNSGVMNTSPSSKSTISSAFPGASFSVSSNGAQDGVAWAVRTDQYTTHGTQVLYAWDATDLSNLLYESDTNSARDSAGPANKFSIPVVTNGKVYVVAVRQVDVYGLFNGEPSAAAPVITPSGGTFSAS